jgi:hypothetical protein
MSSQIYTPGLKRKEICTLRKTRKLPIPGEVLVNKGDIVSHNTIVARTSVPGKPHILNIPYMLGLEPGEVHKYILKKMGETVKKNEAIARFQSFFGLINREASSPVDGTIESLSDITGQLVIRELPTPIEIKAYIPGRVVEVLPKEGCIIETTATFVQGIFGIGGETHGELMMLSKAPKEILESHQITTECDGKILIGGTLVTGDALRKALEVNAKGVIVGGIKDKDLIAFLGYDIGVAITGHERIGLTLVITEGFGKIAMQNKIFELLKKNEGKLACINGATQIRAGVVRPEIIVPNPNFSYINRAEANAETTHIDGLKMGALVRIIRDPYFGLVGRIVSLPVKPQQIETESYVRVVEIELENGKRVIIPRANIEKIDEE